MARRRPAATMARNTVRLGALLCLAVMCSGLDTSPSCTYEVRNVVTVDDATEGRAARFSAAVLRVAFDQPLHLDGTPIRSVSPPERLLGSSQLVCPGGRVVQSQPLSTVDAGSIPDYLIPLELSRLNPAAHLVSRLAVSSEQSGHDHVYTAIYILSSTASDLAVPIVNMHADELASCSVHFPARSGMNVSRVTGADGVGWDQLVPLSRASQPDILRSAPQCEGYAEAAGEFGHLRWVRPLSRGTQYLRIRDGREYDGSGPNKTVLGRGSASSNVSSASKKRTASKKRRASMAKISKVSLDNNSSASRVKVLDKSVEDPLPQPKVVPQSFIEIDAWQVQSHHAEQVPGLGADSLLGIKKAEKTLLKMSDDGFLIIFEEPYMTRMGKVFATALVNKLTRTVASMVVPELSAYIVPAVSTQFQINLAEELVDAMSEYTVPLAVGNTIEPLNAKIARKVGRTIPGMIQSVTPLDVASRMPGTLSHTLARSITHTVVGALTHVLSHSPMQDWYCMLCYKKKEYCSYCQTAPQQLYYNMFYAGYYSAYYSDYYENEWTISLREDLRKSKRLVNAEQLAVVPDPYEWENSWG